MLNKENDVNVIVFNTPKGFDFTRFGKFGASKAYKSKLIFLIHQINYYSQTDKINQDYNLHYKAHYELLGISPNLLQTFLSLLVNQNVIRLSSRYDSRVKKCNHYRILEPFNYKDSADDVEKHFFNLTDKRCPLFIRKWAGDGYKVCESQYSNTVKALSETKPIKEKSDKSIISQQAKKIVELEAKIKALEAELNTLQPSSNGKESNALPTVETQSEGLKLVNTKGEVFTVVNGANFSSHVIAQLKLKYKTKSVCCVVHDENNNEVRFNHDFKKFILTHHILLAS